MVRLMTGKGLCGRRDRSEDGAVAVVVAILATALFIVAAMVVDLGFARDVKRQSQNAADAAALAAGNVLYGNGTTPRFTDAVLAAKNYASSNFGVTEADWVSCTDPAALRHRPASTPCISFQNSTLYLLDATKPDTVRVRIPVRDVDTTLGAVAGVSKIPVAAEAHASIEFTTMPSCALCVLGQGPHDLQNGDITVNGGEVHFNGNVSMNPNGSVTTDKGTKIQGTTTGGTHSPTPTTGVPAITDPLAFMPMPDWSPLTPKSNPCLQGPGIYGSFSFPNVPCVLTPGLYVIAGATSQWSGAGTAAVTGVGVTLFFTCGTPTVPAPCATNGDGATLDMAGSSLFQIEAPLSDPRLAIVFDRNNTETLRIVGSGGSAITGTVYAPSALLQMNGNGCFGAMQSMIVVKSVAMNGDPACLKSNYALSRNVDMPPGQLHLSR